MFIAGCSKEDVLLEEDLTLTEKKTKLDRIASIYKKNGGFKTPRFKFN